MSGRSSKIAKHASEMTDEKIAQVAARLRILGEPMRLKILRAICQEEKNVQEIVQEVGAGQANVSKHLALMLESGIVERRKEGLNCYYRLEDENVFEICQLAVKSVERTLSGRLRRLRVKARA
ncbi:MAG: metalloregulator ArsR/SmtB family transcription factor [Chloroherpetonaceae bacterium]|nr:metalloregulator ArsR/SmtB family transcription factor [Chloroherpetonaceae bacterium]MDW8436588.1 metalloregulator ArsR/SmtB family transcription factor [Chloroherpetonaceae bacterium]